LHHHPDQGEPVTATEHARKSPAAFATLAGLLRGGGSGAPSLRLLATCLGLALLVAGLAIPSTASAAQTRVLQSSFGPDGTAATHFEQPAAIGIDQSTGAAYLADLANGTVQKFDSLHEPTAFTGTNPDISANSLGGFSFAAGEAAFSQIAVASASHDFYVTDHGAGAVKAFQADGEPAIFSAGPGSGTNAIGGFSELCGVAVDSSGDIYAADYFSGVHVYAPSGELLTSLAIEAPCNLAVDSSGALYVNYYAFSGLGVGRFTPSEFPLTAATTYSAEDAVDAANAFGIAIDPTTNHLFVDEHTQVAEYDATGARLAVFGESGPGALSASEGIAVDSATDQVFVSDTTEASERQVEIFGPVLTLPDVTTKGPTEIGPHEATLNGEVSTAGTVPATALTDCHFEYVTQTAFEATGFSDLFSGGEAACEGEVANDGAFHPVKAEITGLQAGTTYHFRLVASNANGQNHGDDRSFATPPKPSIDSAAAIEVTAASAKLTAKVNPQGAETTCQIDWGPTTEPGNPTVPYEHREPCEPSESLGSGGTEVPVSLQLEGLSPDTSYHWRVLATNPSGTTTSPEHTFVFLSPPEHESCPANEAFRTGASATLPDCRVYEMVTPPNKNGALPGANKIINIAPTFSADGSRMIAGSIQCFAEAPSCPALSSGEVGTPYMFSRTASGWVTGSLAPPPQHFVGATDVSAETGMVLYSIPTPPFGEDDLYARALDGSLTDIGPVSYPPLGKPGPAGDFYLSTADFSHVAVHQISDQVGFPFDESQPGPSGRTVYEYAGAGHEPFLVAVSGKQGSTALISRCRSELGADEDFGGNDSALSADGRTVYFTALPCATGSGENAGKEVPADELYARVDGEVEGKAHTVHISAPQCGAGEAAKEKACRSALPANASFQGASRDGSLAYFASTRQLTDEASEDSSDTTTLRCTDATGPNGCNLYLYDLSAAAGQRLIDVSAGDTSGKGPEVQGLLAFSADGSHAYFLANGVLAANEGADGTHASPGDCRFTPDLTQGSGTCNLYLYQRDAAHPAGQTTYIATLPGAGHPEWVTGAEIANVTPDGRFLLFSSTGHLTPDDHASTRQIFRYDAQSGVLVRISIGERGFNDNGNGGVGEPRFVPARKQRRRAGNNGRPSPSISDDGQRVFFQSPIGLTPEAFDDRQISEHEGEPQYAQNIYEYHGGHVSLITDGRDTTPVANDNCLDTAGLIESTTCLIGTDASGNDVFFSSGDQLAPQDTDTGVDYYDARSGGGFAAASGVAPCQGDACSGASTAEGPQPSAATPGFNGKEEGPNHAVKPNCKKGFVRKHSRCVKKSASHRHHHGKKTHRRAANTDRRARG
jgi:hypothetical protein